MLFLQSDAFLSDWLSAARYGTDTDTLDNGIYAAVRERDL
jgi:hypothetical protein